MPCGQNETECFTELWYANCSTTTLIRNFLLYDNCSTTTIVMHGTTCDLALYFLQILNYIILCACVSFIIAYFVKYFIRRRRRRRGHYDTSANA